MNISEIGEQIKKHGCYWDKDYTGKTERYTIYVYVEGEEDIAEEIDVDASGKKHALEIAKKAWERDYQGAVRKMTVVGPRIGLYM